MTLALAGLFGTLMLSGDASACHFKKKACAPAPCAAPEPAPCPAPKVCCFKKFKLFSGGLCHKKAVCAPAPVACAPAVVPSAQVVAPTGQGLDRGRMTTGGRLDDSRAARPFVLRVSIVPRPPRWLRVSPSESNQASSGFKTRPPTSVSRSSRPLWKTVSCL